MGKLKMATDLVLRVTRGQWKKDPEVKKKKKFKIPKNTKKDIKFIESSMPFTICYLNDSFMS